MHNTPSAQIEQTQSPKAKKTAQKRFFLALNNSQLNDSYKGRVVFLL